MKGIAVNSMQKSMIIMSLISNNNIATTQGGSANGPKVLTTKITRTMNRTISDPIIA